MPLFIAPQELREGGSKDYQLSCLCFLCFRNKADPSLVLLGAHSTSTKGSQASPLSPEELTFLLMGGSPGVRWLHPL